MVFFFLIAALAAADLLIKAEIESREGKDFPKPLDKRGWITLHKSHNPGLPFGLLKKNEEAVRMIPVAMASALGGILVWLLQRRGHLYEKLAYSIRIGGALSNLYDRFRRHYVVDYFSINYGRLKKVIFNLGDMMIFAGSLLILIHELWESIRDGR